MVDGYIRLRYLTCQVVLWGLSLAESVQATPYRFEFVGGEPCLDFTNTVGGDRRATPNEHLHSYADLVAWARQGDIVSPAQAREGQRGFVRAPCPHGGSAAVSLA